MKRKKSNSFCHYQFTTMSCCGRNLLVKSNLPSFLHTESISVSDFTSYELYQGEV